jgi:myo-inositol-1(or 4)-monophosphatase
MKETLTSALMTAGNQLMNYFGQQIDSKQKESQSSIVTVADIKSDELIGRIITDQYPDHNILSEEAGFRNKGSIYTWVIDPLDGTSNFASAIPWFGILIALFENNLPVMGGAYLPVTRQLYFAEKGKGTFMNGVRVVLDRHKKIKNSLVAFSVDYTDVPGELERSLEIYKNLVLHTRNIRSTNCLVDFLNVAEGKFGACINLYTRIWDISALGLIISEAGGSLKDISGKDVDYIFDNGTMERNFPVMAGPDPILREIKESVLRL